MPAKQSYEVTMALKWLKGNHSAERTIRQAAQKFGVHESTLWRALGRMNHQRKAK